ncbi:hypothetical protein D9M72_442610 [compost metagenome]
MAQGGGVVVEPAELGRDELGCLGSVVDEEPADQRFLVHRHLDGLAHLDVLQDGHFLVHAQVHHGERVALDDLLPAFDELVEVAHSDGVIAVDLPVEEGLEPGLRVIVGDEVDGADLPPVTPIVLVADQLDAGVLPRGEAVGTGTDGVQGIGRHGLAVPGLAEAVRLLRRHGRRGGHGEGRERQRLEEPGERLGEVDPDVPRRNGGAALVDGERRLVGVGLEHALERGSGRLLPQARREVEPSVEVGADSRGIEACTVLEGDALAELEGVGAAFVGFRPLSGEQGSGQPRGLVHSHKALQDLAGDPVGLHIGCQRGIKSQRLGRRAEGERRGRGSGGSACRSRRGRRRSRGRRSCACGQQQRQDPCTDTDCNAARFTAGHSMITSGRPEGPRAADRSPV